MQFCPVEVALRETSGSVQIDRRSARARLVIDAGCNVARESQSSTVGYEVRKPSAVGHCGWIAGAIEECSRNGPSSDQCIEEVIPRFER